MRIAVRTKQTRHAWAFVVLIVTTIGCRNVPPQVHLPPPYTAYRSPHLLEAPPRRILLMPPVAPHQFMKSANVWNEQLANELRSIRKFEVVRANPALAPVANCLADIQRGQFSEGALLELRNTLRVDGILFVSFHDCYVYWPPRLAVAVNLVETENGETVAAIDGNWDARDETTKMQAVEYAKRVTTSREFSDPTVILESPHYFGKYVAADIAHGLCMLWNPEEEPGEATSDPSQTAGAPANAADCPTPGNPPAVSPTGAEAVFPTAGSAGDTMASQQEEVLPAPVTQ